MRKIGARIGAILKGNDEEVQLLGFGTYAGDEVPIGAVGWIAEALVEEGVTNPKLVLDNGAVVWGCECWWGSEAAVLKMIGDRRLVHVDIEKVRAENRG